MKVFNQTISEIVDENYIYARALNQLGILFYECPNRLLGDICKERGLNKDQVMRSFYLFDQNQRLSLIELKKYPIAVVIQYLKYTHSIFIKNKLPYIADLINHTDGDEDLKLIFPEFIGEFINHIYEEEDTVFNYIYRLIEVDAGKVPNPFATIYTYDKYSLSQIFEVHTAEDELSGIRNLVEGVTRNDLHWQVIKKELKSFDREMMYHAEIENNIMFPKAILLESQVNKKLKNLSQLN